MGKAGSHFVKQWEISFAELEDTVGKLFKVTRRLPAMDVAGNKTLRSKGETMQQFNEWLR